MKGIFFAAAFFLITTLFIPVFIVTRCDLKLPLREQAKTQEIIQSDLKVTVFNHKTKEIMRIDLEEYVAQVVAAEMPGSFEIEALKAQAVAARTYAIKRNMIYGEEGHPDHAGAVLCTSHAHCQEWLSMDELKKRHGRRWMDKYWRRIEKAARETAGIIMTYNTMPIEPLYHSTSGGRTENSEDVFAAALPYLRSISSYYEEDSPVLVDQARIPAKEFISTLKAKDKEFKINEKNIISQIEILKRNQGGSIRSIRIGNKIFTGKEIRQLFGLRSADFTVENRGRDIIFITRGYGHGVGMSQWGANGMAENGANYKEILKHYYQGVTLSAVESYR